MKCNKKQVRPTSRLVVTLLYPPFLLASPAAIMIIIIIIHRLLYFPAAVKGKRETNQARYCDSE